MSNPTASRRCNRCLVLALSACMVAFVLAPLRAQQQGEKELYQDFRGKRPLLPSLEMRGAGNGAVISAEDDGLRISLPATTKANQTVEIQTTFALVGDFEVTGTFASFSGDMPAKGYGVGVSLNVAKNEQREKLAWIARMMRPGKGTVFASENWDKNIENSYRFRSKPTEAKVGQLRLVRSGAKLLCLASEGPGKEFIKINEIEKFGAEDMERGVRFQVVNSNSPGNRVEVLLVDLRIRHGMQPAPALAVEPRVPFPAVDAERKPDPNDLLTKASAPAPLAPPAPVVEPERATLAKDWLVLTLLAGLATSVLFAGMVGLWLYLRQRRPQADAAVESEEAEPAAARFSLGLTCRNCGKKLKTKAHMIGKKVKCGQCGKVVLVPEPEAPEA